MKLTPVPLTVAAFAPYGEVLAPDETKAVLINAGTCMRFADLSRVDTDAAGQASISVFRAAAADLPLSLTMFERHPHGSQAFVPLRDACCCIIVTTGTNTPDLADVQAFVTPAGTGFNLRRNVWHCPLVALDRKGEFLVVDRTGPGDNLETFPFKQELVVLAPR